MQSLQHRQTWDLIPWLVNGTASPVERSLAEAHLAICTDCRDEYAFQARLGAGLAVDVVTDGPLQPALDQLLARIDVEEANTVARPPLVRPQLVRMTRILAAAVIVQAIGLAVLGSWALERSRSADEAPYRTLSTTAIDAPEATIRFVPSPELSVGQMQRLLADNGLRVANANEGGTIFALAPSTPAHPTASTGEVVARLRAAAGVLLAEPIARDADAR
jgi:hypothetical protein